MGRLPYLRGRKLATVINHLHPNWDAPPSTLPSVKFDTAVSRGQQSSMADLGLGFQEGSEKKIWLKNGHGISGSLIKKNNRFGRLKLGGCFQK